MGTTITQKVVLGILSQESSGALDARTIGERAGITTKSPSQWAQEVLSELELKGMVFVYKGQYALTGKGKKYVPKLEDVS